MKEVDGKIIKKEEIAKIELTSGNVIEINL